jgi:hypothetical protein
MHFDFLIEDVSGKRTLEILIPKLLDNLHTHTIHSYKGVGHIPKGLKSTLDPSTRVLLNQLPRLIQGFGNTYKGYGSEFSALLIIIVDLDSKNRDEFLTQLEDILEQCNPKPETRFCLAIEEGEAWFLGDINAITMAYPSAKKNILSKYTPDSICGTWELLADAIYSGGVIKLKKKGRGEIGKEKSNWAINITSHMNVNNNSSPSFCYFRDIVKGYNY